MFFIQQIFLKNNPWYKLHINEKSSVKNFCLNMKKENLKNNYKKIEPVHISKILMPLFIYSQDHSLKLNEQKLNPDQILCLKILFYFYTYQIKFENFYIMKIFYILYH